MGVCVLTVRLHAPWVHSLKEKRMELNSLLTRLRNTFNVSVAEVDEQDTHTVMVIGVAALAADAAQADSMQEHMLHFIETHTQAEVIAVERERR